MRNLRRKRRPIAAVLFLVLFLTACGKTNYTGIRLKNPEQISETIRTTMLHRSYSVRISFMARTLDETVLEKEMDRLVEDALYESEDPHGGDYLRYQYGGHELRHSQQKKMFRYRYEAQLIPNYYTSKEQEEWVDQEVEKILATLPIGETEEGAAEESEQEMSVDRELQKIQAVRTYVEDHVEYDMVHKRIPGSKHYQSTAYGALFYHTALCQGYSVLAYRLLKELGIENRIVTGIYKEEEVLDKKGNVEQQKVEERHAWNLVKVGGAYYNVDFTMGDVKENSDYFLKTEEVFKKNYTRDSQFETEEWKKTYPMGQKNLQVKE